MKTLLFAVLALALVSCTHAQQVTAARVYKFTREGALATCAVEEMVAPALVTVEGAQVPVLVARAVCAVIRAFPESIGVIATPDGVAMPLDNDSGGSNGHAEGGRENAQTGTAIGAAGRAN